jgi:hypothetical protein
MIAYGWAVMASHVGRVLGKPAWVSLIGGAGAKRPASAYAQISDRGRGGKAALQREQHTLVS